MLAPPTSPLSRPPAGLPCFDTSTRRSGRRSRALQTYCGDVLHAAAGTKWKVLLGPANQPNSSSHSGSLVFRHLQTWLTDHNIEGASRASPPWRHPPSGVRTINTGATTSNLPRKLGRRISPRVDLSRVLVTLASLDYDDAVFLSHTHRRSRL
ncbi:hypothetical protein ElyMa_005732100 [Elysia marginata]|uniref:Uncharacterized protein n=1 Tax=Elysia marginata TaxID=1093978 RepID=A0AAV4FKN1_9GAST|nr:hypothetical protein ElyMa_005732100 [Elysia marginata]